MEKKLVGLVSFFEHPKNLVEINANGLCIFQHIFSLSSFTLFSTKKKSENFDCICIIYFLHTRDSPDEFMYSPKNEPLLSEIYDSNLLSSLELVIFFTLERCNGSITIARLLSWGACFNQITMRRVQ